MWGAAQQCGCGCAALRLASPCCTCTVRCVRRRPPGAARAACCCPHALPCRHEDAPFIFTLPNTLSSIASTPRKGMQAIKSFVVEVRAVMVYPEQGGQRREPGGGGKKAEKAERCSLFRSPAPFQPGLLCLFAACRGKRWRG